MTPNGTRVVVVSMDALPGASYMGSGPGLRAWGLGQGLQAKGFGVTYLIPKKRGNPTYPEHDVREYTLRGLGAQIRAIAPEVTVFQNWARVPAVGPLDMPVVIDFHGPSVIEMEIMQNRLAWLFKRLKLEAISKADAFTCAGHFQKNYFLGWLLLGGVPVDEDPIGVVHVSMPPEMPAWEPPEEITFVHGGHFLPWVDTSAALHDLVDFLERTGKGRLKVFGGKHPMIPVPDERTDRLLDRLAGSPAVDFSGMVPAEEVTERYRQCHVAVDLQRKNPERCLAFTTRTVHYLWCGLPVIYNDYAELAPYIQRYEAGWTLDPEDRAGYRRLLEQICSDPGEVHRRSRNAQRLVAEHLTHEKAVGDLARFCEAPRRRETKPKPLTHLQLARSVRMSLWRLKSRLPFPGGGA